MEISEIWEMIKSSLDVYFKYKNNPRLLAEERPREYLHLRELCPTYEDNRHCKVDHTLCRFPACLWFNWKDINIEEYNDWLLKLIFYIVLKENDEK